MVAYKETKIHQMSTQLVKNIEVGRFLGWGVVQAKGMVEGVVVLEK